MRRFLNKSNGLIFFMLFTFLAAWNRGINLLYILFALLAATLILSYLLPKFSLRRLSASRKIPDTAFEDDVLELRVQVSNPGWSSAHMIEIIDTIPAAPPNEQHPMTFIGNLPARSTREFSLCIPCYKRGRYEVGPLKLQSAYPLGLSTAKKPLASEKVPLLVYPKVLEMLDVPVLSSSHLLFSGVESLSKVGGGQEFFGTREYRQGDSLRHVHWPSTARHGRMIVKEFEVRGGTEVTILLDLHKSACTGEGRENTLEYMVKITAAVSKYLLDRGNKVQLIAFGKKQHILPPAGGVNHFAAILEVLAQVVADGGIAYPLMLQQTASFLNEGSTALLFFCNPEQKQELYVEALGLLHVKRVRPLGVFFDRPTFLNRPPIEKKDKTPLAALWMNQGFWPYWLKKGDDLKAVFTLGSSD